MHASTAEGLCLDLSETDSRDEEPCPVRFTGSGEAYFRIWIVNLLLTILTLGIYSAWAKVRRLQYFYRSTLVDGSAFDYHGDPLAILKGRLVALALILVYSVAVELSPLAGGLAALLFALALPWLLTQSMRFSLHNTSLRGLRFRFDRTARTLYLLLAPPMVLVILAGVVVQTTAQGEEVPAAPLAVAGGIYLVLLAALPWLLYRFKRFQVEGVRYGQARADFSGRAGGFYRIYGIAFVIVVGAGLLAAAVIGVLMAGVVAADGGEGSEAAAGAAVLVTLAGVLFFYGLMLALWPYLVARLQNYVWNRSRLGPVGFESRVRARTLIGIVLTNLFLILLTLGLYTPFAAVRLYRYRVESVALAPGADLAAFAGRAGAEVGTVGEGAVDLLDFDLAL